MGHIQGCNHGPCVTERGGSPVGAPVQERPCEGGHNRRYIVMFLPCWDGHDHGADEVGGCHGIDWRRGANAGIRIRSGCWKLRRGSKPNVYSPKLAESEYALKERESIFSAVFGIRGKGLSLMRRF